MVDQDQDKIKSIFKNEVSDKKISDTLNNIIVKYLSIADKEINFAKGHEKLEKIMDLAIIRRKIGFSPEEIFKYIEIDDVFKYLLNDFSTLLDLRLERQDLIDSLIEIINLMAEKITNLEKNQNS